MTSISTGKILALCATLAMAAVVGYFAWSGFKAPPVAAPAAIVTTPPGWAKLDGGHFTLYAPPGAELRKADKDGLTYGDIINAPLCIRFTAGKRAAPAVTPKSHPDFADEPITVDGRTATLRKAVLQAQEQQYWFPGCTAPFYAALIVPGVLSDGGDLVIDAIATSGDGLEDATTMFKSVRIAKGG